MSLNFNTDPYNDDYSEDSKFYKILFRPGYPVQARELTQLQTILQTQIARHGSAVFKQGAMVIPGQMSLYTKVDFIKLQASYGGISIDSYINQFNGCTITGTSGLTAKVFYVAPATVSDPHMLYVVYTNSSTSGAQEFATNEVITTGSYSAQVASTDATGQGSFASILRGVYYVNGQFVLVEPQTIVLDKFGTTPSYRVGLFINEKVVTPEEDETLLDNAQGSYNYAAPGAHRHFMELVLDKRTLTDTDDADFITLSVVDNGIISRDTRITEYSELEKTLARRTYDESGSYVVRNFELDVREYRNNNRGAWTTATPYIAGDVVTNAGQTYTCLTQGISSVAPTSTDVGSITADGTLSWENTPNPAYNRGIFSPLVSETTLADHLANEAKLAVGLEPGKAYVEGYEIEKIATEFVPTPKARTLGPAVNNYAIPANVGNYVIVSGSSNIPVTFSKVTIYDRFVSTPGTAPAGGNVVGTAYVHGLEYHNGTQQKLFLFGITMNTGYNFARHAKSFYIAAINYTANIVPTYEEMTGSVSASTTTLTGVGTSFLTDLIAGDILYIPGATTYVQIAAVTSQTTATLVASATFTGQAYQMVGAEVVDPMNADNVYRLPYYAVASVSNVQYNTFEKFANVTSDASGNATFTYTGTGTLLPYTVINYLIAANNAIVTPTTANVVGNQLILTGMPASTTISCVGTAQYTGVLGTTEKVKTLTTQTTTITTSAAGGTIIQLDKADGFKLARVEMDTTAAFGGTPTWTNTVDITDRYDFYDGQTESFYGPAFLKLKDSYVPASNPIRVTYQYFSHGTGQYFSLNSYGSVHYSRIPSYGDMDLRDVLDFRPRTDDGVTIAGTAPIKNGTNMFLNMTYYQGRKDLITMGTDGAFIISNGQTDDVPVSPKAPPNTITLYALSLQPYTFNTTPAQIEVVATDNRRYTMRDIGVLEKRIEQLEYYTTLSMLEQETKNTSITDELGNERYKNGFVVDNFKGSGIGDPSSPDWVCATDAVAGNLRPYFAQQNLKLLEQATGNTARLASKYAVWGDVLTMALDQTTPYVAMIKQEYGTRTENVSPLAVFTFLGEMSLNPATDEWFEEKTNPVVVVNTEGHHSHPKGHRATHGIHGTKWKGWKRHWHGEKVEHAHPNKPKVKDRHKNHNHGKKHNHDAEHEQRNRQEFAYDESNHHHYHHHPKEDVHKHHAKRKVRPVHSHPKGEARHKIHHHKPHGTKVTVVDEKTVSTDVIPYIRSRTVLVQAKLLRPNTVFHAFFDGVNVDDYCEQSTIVTYTPTNGKEFDDKTPVGKNAKNEARKLKKRKKHNHNHPHRGHDHHHLNKGDQITGNTGITGIVVGKHKHNGVHKLHIHNVKKGKLKAGHTLQGSIPDDTLAVAQGTVVSVVEPTAGVLKSDDQGNLNFTFTIPNSESLRFRTGQREFMLIDSTTDDVDTVTSRAHAFYLAKGVLETTTETTVISVRPRQHSTHNINDARVEIGSSDPTRTTPSKKDPKIRQKKRPVDPLAQTFFVQNDGGALLTHIDIFFASKDDNIPITLELREVVNGYPGDVVLPFSRVVLQPDEINISSTNVTVGEGSAARLVPKWDTPTTFRFESPVYVKDGEEYAIVLIAETQGYNVWISQMGDRVAGSQRSVSSQPNMGSLFKSQNASTWTADQMQDLMFTIWRANFDIGTTDLPTQALCRFINDDLPYEILESDPLEVRSGSNKVRVHFKNHNLVENSQFTLLPDFVEPDETTTFITTSTASTAFSSTTDLAALGIAVGTTIYDDNETLIGTVATIGTTSGTFTANGAVNLTAAPFKFVPQTIAGIANTEIYKKHTSISFIDADWFCITASTNATVTGYFGGDGVRCEGHIMYDVVHPTVQALNFPETKVSYSMLGTSGKSVDGTQTPFAVDIYSIPLTENEDNEMPAPKMIANAATQTALMAGADSIKFDISMQSSNASLSPIVDLHRLSVTAISNRINKPTEVNTNVGGLDDQRVVTSSLIAFTAASSSITSADSATAALLTAIPVGRVIAISGSTTGSNNTTWLVTGTLSNGITVTTQGGSTALATQATGTSITITQRVTYMSEIAPQGSSSLSKFVTKRINLDNASTYLRVIFGAAIPVDSSVEVYYRTCPTGATVDMTLLPWTLMTPDNPIVNSSTTFTDVNYTGSNMTPYDGLMVKIVFKGTNSADVPVIKDLRIISCA